MYSEVHNLYWVIKLCATGTSVNNDEDKFVF